MNVFDDTPCQLGEGPLWHPKRKQLFWFDILGKRLHSRQNDETLTWQFKEHVSAAGWLDLDHLLIASETRLFRFNLNSQEQQDIAPLEADVPGNRSNDGRADPWGGFWIGTMGFNAEPGAGAFYRYYKGELRTLYENISISNACCFSPDRRFAYFVDTSEGIVKRVSLDPENGWPTAAPENWLDFRGEDWGSDGAVIDADGNFWNAQWGGWRVACYAPDGTFIKAIEFDAAHTSCPAFGGPDGKTLFCTAAAVDVSDENKARSPHHGKTFALAGVARGQNEHQVIL